MASTSSFTKANNLENHTKMKSGDVDAVGAHCQMEYCHILDLLPFPCQSCKGKFCLDHRTEYAHNCPKAGEWARKAPKAPQEETASSLPSKPSLYDHDQQCYEITCKTLINTSRMPANQCSSCNRSYCLKHRMPEVHDCKNVPRPGAAPSGGSQPVLTALVRMKLWAGMKRDEDNKRRSASKKSGFLGMRKSSGSAAATALAEINALKRTAKGEANVPSEKRIYLHVEASTDTTKAKYPTGKFFYNVDWTVGRVLDMAAKSLQVENVNNRGGGEEEKLRVFHVEGGRLLKFGEKIGESCKNGNMIVLLRGVGSGELNLIDL